MAQWFVNHKTGERQFAAVPPSSGSWLPESPYAHREQMQADAANSAYIERNSAAVGAAFVTWMRQGSIGARIMRFLLVAFLVAVVILYVPHSLPLAVLCGIAAGLYTARR